MMAALATLGTREEKKQSTFASFVGAPIAILNTTTTITSFTIAIATLHTLAIIATHNIPITTTFTIAWDQPTKGRTVRSNILAGAHYYGISNTSGSVR
jgi:hypothetical protein